jgi:DeoR family transcriptional regulator, glycerol-3-phosphate regulon repressor
MAESRNAGNEGNRTVALNFRQTEILELARAEGRVVVEDLATRFDVTLQTIRRDLSDLSDAGHLDRVHGGAVLRTGVANIGYEARRRMNEGAKAAIARACAAAIPDNCSLILNLGTTTEAVAREMLGHRNITVITNNMNVANILVANPGCEIVVAGGLRGDRGLGSGPGRGPAGLRPGRSAGVQSDHPAVAAVVPGGRPFQA